MRKLLKLKRSWLLILFPIEIIVLLICKANATIAEYVFARFIYRILSIPMGILTGWIPFSVAEIVLYLLVIAAIAVPVAFFIHLKKGKGRRKTIVGKAILNILCAVSVISAMFVFMCGVNYYRYSFTEYLDYKATESDKDQLYEMCVHLAERVNEARADITNVDEEGVMKLSYDSTADFLDEAEDIMSEFVEDYEALKWSTGSIKPVLASHYMSYTDIVGIFIPFTMEANLNVDIVDYNKPSDALHELAHLRGVMPEDEANYVSYLACIGSGRSDFVYSGYMMAYIHASNKLYKEDKELYTQVRNMLDVEVIRDLYANSQYWKQFETPAGEVISQVSTSINNAYLQVNGQENGVKSYGMVVDLLLAEFRYMKGQK